LLGSPLLAEGQALREAETVLVSIVGGLDLSMAEVNRVMEQLNRQAENAQFVLGATVDESLRDRLEITLIVSGPAPAKPAQPAQPAAAPATDKPTEAVPAQPEPEMELEDQYGSHKPSPRPPPRYLPPPPNLSQEEAKKLMKQQSGPVSRLRNAIPRLRQGQLPLEIISKGRFEKSEPTIRHGEDLDVPTYIRHNVPLN